MAKKLDKYEDVAVVRIKELYPIAHAEFAQIFNNYSKANHVIWLQEEPQNNGAWYHIRHFVAKLVHDDQSKTNATAVRLIMMFALIGVMLLLLGNLFNILRVGGDL